MKDGIGNGFDIPVYGVPAAWSLCYGEEAAGVLLLFPPARRYDCACCDFGCADRMVA